jgi:predicted XRE-type DNA-binding protein
MPKDRRYHNTFEAVGYPQVEAEDPRIRADLMLEVARLVEARGFTQAEAAKLFHVTQPRISDLTRGKIERFSIDTLVEMLACAGVDVMVNVRRSKYAA